MTVKELEKFLKRSKIPSFLYNISGKGLEDERICLRKDGDTWNVFIGSRGHMLELIQHKSESDACNDVLTRLFGTLKWL